MMEILTILAFAAILAIIFLLPYMWKRGFQLGGKILVGIAIAICLAYIIWLIALSSVLSGGMGPT